MKTITLTGIIKTEYNEHFETIKLIQEDGYKIDLVGRFKEAAESYKGLEIQVSYHLSEKVSTKSEMIQSFIKKLHGIVDAGFESSPYEYSEWTTGTDYDTNLMIGGHDLFSELRHQQGKFIIIDLTIK